ncbi:MAG: alcohol dehydrogenase catalytic domain-containing protein [Actinomycetota bacterium]|nr:alcohol dehydrogenase catalytic domain-containing protein [Actinomycetota bacterium]
MRALVLRDFWQLAVQERPAPEAGPTDVLIDVLATGICGSDFHGFSGENGRRQPGQVMGHETVGRVSGLGSAVPQGLRLGDVVTVNPVLACGWCEACRAGMEQSCPTKRVIGVDPSISSAFAEQLVAPASNVIALPTAMPVEYGALVEPLAVGYHALRRGNCRQGDRVVVIGSGPIGQACVLAATRLGAVAVVASEPHAGRRALVERIGAGTVDPTGTADLGAAVAAALGGAPTLVIDAVGVTATLTSAFACAGLTSTIVLVGMGSPELQVPAFEVSTKERSVVGSFCYSAAEFRETADWVGTAPAELAQLIQQRVGLDQAQDAFVALASGTSNASKILVLPSGSSEATTGGLR